MKFYNYQITFWLFIFNFQIIFQISDSQIALWLFISNFQISDYQIVFWLFISNFQISDYQIAFRLFIPLSGRAGGRGASGGWSCVG